MTPAEWRARGQDLEHEGRRLFYVAEGSGPVLLCIHGFPTSSFDWVPLWGSLTSRFRVVAADMLGLGYSEKPKGHPLRIVDQADLLEALLADLGHREVHVLAHDLGDSVAQELLARAHERRGAVASGPGPVELRSLVFLNGGLFPETHRPRPVQTLLMSPLGPLVARLTSFRTYARNMTRVFGPETPPSSQFLRDTWSLLERDGGRLMLPALIRYMAERRVHRDRWVAAMQNTAVPLRLINGTADPVSGAHAAQRYRELVPAPDVVLLEGIGHYPQEEAPERVLAAFLAFHDEHCGSVGKCHPS